MLPSIDKFVERMVYWCSEGNLGYDQSNRWDIRYGGECDCSSLVIFALRESGFDTGSASYTGDMSSNLCARGWNRVANDGNPQYGDILLNDANHVAAYVGNGQLAQASIDENGRISGGAGGDQSDRETNVRSYYDYPWDCYLRYTGESSGSSTTSTSNASTPDNGGETGSGVVYQVHTLAHGWLGEIDHVGDDEDGYAGWQGSPIDAVRAYRTDGQPLKVRTHALGGGWWDWTEFNGSMQGSNPSGDGYSGNFGTPIDGIMVEGASVRTATRGYYWDWTTDGDNPSGDGYSGNFGEAITALQMRA